MVTFFLQASRIIAQFIVMGSGILGRAFFQAYRQAIASEFQHLFFYNKCSFLYIFPVDRFGLQIGFSS